MSLVKKLTQSYKYQSISTTLKRSAAYAIRKTMPRWFNELLKIYYGTRPIEKRTCSCCGYYGFFGVFGSPPRLDAQCPNCVSVERHRLFCLGHERGLFFGEGKFCEPVLHFAPEKIIENILRKKCMDYKSADLFEPADLKLDIEKIDIEDGSVGTVIANHVLEHVNDKKAISEIYRILKPGGIFIASIPIIEGWKYTYENEAVSSPAERVLHFGQYDHVRYYGADFRDRVHIAGFRTENEITSEGEDVIRFGLLRGEKVFVFRK